jgi:hypothetical protein
MLWGPEFSALLRIAGNHTFLWRVVSSGTCWCVFLEKFTDFSDEHTATNLRMEATSSEKAVARDTYNNRLWNDGNRFSKNFQHLLSTPSLYLVCEITELGLQDTWFDDNSQWAFGTRPLKFDMEFDSKYAYKCYKKYCLKINCKQWCETVHLHPRNVTVR